MPRLEDLMSQHAEYRFSVTIHTDDAPVLFCLRALSQFAQKTGNVRIPWGGTKELDWEKAGHRVTFHFSRASYRDIFIREALRLLPADSWKETQRSDTDPAKPQA